ncbi:MAG: class I SAM-dependent methyltransferase [Usitatibacter sp.]
MLRRIVKKIPALYWLAGWARYLQFRWKLAKADHAHSRVDRPGALPPPILRHRVHGALDEASYTEVGRSVARRIAAIAQSHGVALENLEILDFGCGPGRVAVELKALTVDCRHQGSDIDDEAIAWASRNLAHVGSFGTNGATPPTSFADSQFDLIYTVSLFTHLDERNQDLWLAELARILKPGGTLLATVHGAPTLAGCTEEERAELRERGIVFRVGRRGRLKLDGLPDFYQTTFHTREYVARKWSRLLVVAEYIEGGIGGHQDVVVMKRP